MEVIMTEGNGLIKNWASQLDENAKQQLINTASLPFIFKHVAVMPDAHLGMGATVGSVIASKSAVCPSAVGVDIGCGMLGIDLKRKVDAGAEAVYTQLFFSNDKFFKFYELYQKAGIKVPLIPGIMPITDYARIKHITQMCGAHFPKGLEAKLEKVKDDKAEQINIGVDHALKQCQEFIDQGMLGIHFYALNLSKACRRVLKGLGY